MAKRSIPWGLVLVGVLALYMFRTVEDMLGFNFAVFVYVIAAMFALLM